jgi:branched-subunit amino acid transport protein
VGRSATVVECRSTSASRHPMNVWLLLIGMGLVTYAIRLSLIVLIGRVDVPPLIQRALRFVPPAVLSAIIFPELLRPGGTLDLSFGNVRLLAGILAALVAWRTKNVLLTIGVGMVALWVLQVVIPH